MRGGRQKVEPRVKRQVQVGQPLSWSWAQCFLSPTCPTSSGPGARRPPVPPGGPHRHLNQPHESGAPLLRARPVKALWYTERMPPKNRESSHKTPPCHTQVEAPSAESPPTSLLPQGTRAPSRDWTGGLGSGQKDLIRHTDVSGQAAPTLPSQLRTQALWGGSCGVWMHQLALKPASRRGPGRPTWPP